MVPSASTLEVDDRANELYWGSDRSVNQIAEELDLSKGALYGMIRPLAAALGCPKCGAEVVHPNRTAKERGLVDCPACPWDGSEDDASASFEAAIAGSAAELGDADGKRPYTVPEAGGRSRLGATLLGAAAGLALVLWVRRR